MAYGESNGHLLDDLTCPVLWPKKTTVVFLSRDRITTVVILSW